MLPVARECHRDQIVAERVVRVVRPVVLVAVAGDDVPDPRDPLPPRERRHEIGVRRNSLPAPTVMSRDTYRLMLYRKLDEIRPEPPTGKPASDVAVYPL